MTLNYALSAVIYDGCPKTITQGIWWPRTKFNLPAAVPCPKGSVGANTLTNTLTWVPVAVGRHSQIFFFLLFLQAQPSDTVMWREGGWSQTFTTAPRLRLWSSTLLYVHHRCTAALTPINTHLQGLQNLHLSHPDTWNIHTWTKLLVPLS